MTSGKPMMNLMTSSTVRFIYLFCFHFLFIYSVIFHLSVLDVATCILSRFAALLKEKEVAPLRTNSFLFGKVSSSNETNRKPQAVSV